MLMYPIGGATRSDESRVLAGILVLSLVTVEPGGLYLLKLWRKPEAATAFQVGFARAGHAHAGVLLVLGLLCTLLVDQTEQAGFVEWLSRTGAAAAAILMPAGFFASSMGPGRERPNGLIVLVYAGAVVLAAGLGPGSRSPGSGWLLRSCSCRAAGCGVRRPGFRRPPDSPAWSAGVRT
jgi:hypothetical protein